MEKRREILEIWGDKVGSKDLVISIFFSLLFTMIGFFLADKDSSSQQLLFGLTGAILAFLLNTFLIKPKRILKEEKNEKML